MEAAGTGTAPGGCASAREAAEAPGSPALPSRREEVEEEREAAGPCRGRASGRRGAEAGGGRGRGGRRPPRVTVDSSKAKTSLEALKISLRQLRWREFPFGRRLPCDIYWHGVSFHDNDIFSGQVNKFPDWKIYFASYSGLAQEEAQSKASQMDF